MKNVATLVRASRVVAQCGLGWCCLVPHAITIATRTENVNDNMTSVAGGGVWQGVGGGVVSSGSFASATSAAAATFELILTVLWQRQRRLQLHCQMEPYPRQPIEKFWKRGRERERDRMEAECGRSDLCGPHFIVWTVIRFTFRSVCSSLCPFACLTVSQFMQHRQGLKRAKVFGRARSLTAAKLVAEIN